ncbi:MAG: OmpA family protein [Clostridiales Family XIII bacterium]|jgi:chemotaxis protein MotB|nr:OmpA family protein [Clostridiales Family XIII bacterium]
MAKRKEEHEEHTDESWLVPYADILTLLLALFIVLFASSSVDEQKYNSMAEALYTAFNGYFSDIASEGMGGEGSGDLGGRELPYPNAGKEGEQAAADEQAAAEAAAQQLGNLFESLSQYVTENNLEDTIAVRFEGESVLVVLKNDVWFESGSAGLTSTMYAQAGTLADLIQANQTPEEPLEVVVAGYTDNIPSNTALYPSNWHLSFARATNFLAMLLEDGDLSPEHFSARAYGELHPIAPNDTPEGRKLNRRVELLISRPKIIAPPDNLFMDAIEERLNRGGANSAATAPAAEATEEETPQEEE